MVRQPTRIVWTMPEAAGCSPGGTTGPIPYLVRTALPGVIAKLLGKRESRRGRDGSRNGWARERTMRMRDETVRKAAVVADGIKGSAEKAVRAVRHVASAPLPLPEEGAHVARVGHAQRGPVLAVGAGLVVLLLVRRRRVRR